MLNLWKNVKDSTRCDWHLRQRQQPQQQQQQQTTQPQQQQQSHAVVQTAATIHTATAIMSLTELARRTTTQDDFRRAYTIEKAALPSTGCERNMLVVQNDWEM